MLWIALHLPALPLESFLAGLPEAARGQPVALLDAAGRAVDTANDAARALGVKPGVRRATALALAPQLVHQRRGAEHLAREAQSLRAVAHVALAFTPAVTLPAVLPMSLDGTAGDPPSAAAQRGSRSSGGPRLGGAEAGRSVLLDVQASLRHFGGPGRSLPRLLGLLRDALVPLGHVVRSASAPTALGAALLARGAGEAVGGDGSAGRPAGGGFDHVVHCADRPALMRCLDDVPVGLLDSGREHHDVLRGMGLHTLGDLRRLPRSGLARRLGEPLLDELDRALGRCPDPRDWVVLPAVFEARLELFTLADSTEQVLYGAGLLLARLIAWARAQQARVRRFTLLMRHERRHRRDRAVDLPESSTLEIALGEPSCDVEHLRVLLRERLAHVQLAAPTLELTLRCDDVARGGPPTAELFAGAGSEREGLLRLVERLQARLGGDRVLRLQPVADHRPERAVVACPAAAPQAGRALVGASSATVMAAGRPPRMSSPPSATARPVADRPAGVREAARVERGHRPQRAVPTKRPPAPAATVLEPAGAAAPKAAGRPLAAKADWPPANHHLPTPRPVWLLREPRPLPECGSRPTLDGRPLQLLCGPERIESGWWDAAGLAERDYFIAQAADGALVWVYRLRLPLLAPEVMAPDGDEPPAEPQAPPPGWFLQGRFA